MAEAVAVSVAKAFWWVAAKAGAKVWVARAVAQAAFHVSQIAITAAISYGISAATRPRGGASLGGELDLQVDADFPRQLIVGTRAVGGSLVAHFSTGTNNNNLHLVYALADHPCVALKRVWADGRIVRDATLTHGVRTEITAYSYSGGARVWMTWWDGRPGQVASSGLITASGGEWTTDHKGAGVSYVHVELQIDSDILTSVPRFIFEVQGAKLYNRRKDSTSGGSGSHRLSDPATWEYSENVMDAAQHYLLGYKVENEDIAFGVGLSPTEIPYGDYAAAADLCDEDVVTGTGGAVATIKRYAANGVIGADQFFEDVLVGLQTQMGGRLVDLGGRIAMIGAEARTPVVDLTDEDWDVEDPVTYEDRRRYAELYGAVEGRYTDPGAIYQPAEIERQEVAALALPDGGEAQTQTLELSFETHPRRAARLARMWLEREQRQARLSGRFGPAAYELEPGDWFTYSSDIEQLTDAKFEVIDIVKHEDFTVTLTAQAVDPDIVAFDNDNDPDLSVPGWIDPESLLLAAPTFTVAATSLAVSGSLSEPAITFTLTSTDRLAREIVIEWRRWISGALENVSYWDVAHTDQTVTLLRKGLLPTTDYKVRAKVRAGRKESTWSSWSSVVTTPAISFDWSLIGGTGVPASGATRNVLTVSGTTPSSPANGDLWGDTSANPVVWKVRSAGAWVSVASFGGVFGSTLYENASTIASLANFKTALGTAAAITGQAAAATDSTIQSGATRNALTVSGTAPSSPADGDLWADTSSTPTVWKVRSAGAWVSAAAFGGVFGASLYESSSTIATLANFKTALGTAAAITGQAAAATDSTIQTGATKNTLSVQSTAPSSPGNGDLWLDTSATPYVWKVRQSGSWNNAASLGGVFGSTVYESAGVTAALNAFKTSLGTAAAITGQGDLATANRASLPFGANGIINSAFTDGLVGWAAGWDGNTGLSISRGRNLYGYWGSRDVVYGSPNGTPAIDTVWDLYAVRGADSLENMRRYALPLKGGERVYVSALVSTHRCRASFTVAFYNWAGGYLSETGTTPAEYSPNGAGGGDPAGFTRAGAFMSAHPDARFAVMWVRGVSNGGELNPYVFFTEAQLCIVADGQTSAPAYTPAPPDRYANRTSENTASAISGQGALATLNNVAVFASTAPSGQIGGLTLNTWVTVGLSVTPTTTASSKVRVDVQSRIDVAAFGGGGQVNLRLKRNGSVIETTNAVVQFSGSNVGLMTACWFVDTPGAGSTTYSLEAYVDTPNSPLVYMDARKMTATVFSA